MELPLYISRITLEKKSGDNIAYPRLLIATVLIPESKLTKLTLNRKSLFLSSDILPF